MINRKVSAFLGVFCIGVGLFGFFFIDNNVRRTSKEMGDAILMAKVDIPEGFIIKSQQDLNDYFTVRKVPKTDEIKNAITVDTVEKFSLSSILHKSELTDLHIDPNFIQNLVNKKVTTTLLPNQQVSANWLSNDVTEYGPNDRIFNFSVSLNTAVGGEINVGDYVDVWTSQTSNIQKVLGPIRILKIKSPDNLESTPQQRIIPATVIVKCSEEQIIQLKKVENQNLFLTKYGVKPSNTGNQ